MDHLNIFEHYRHDSYSIPLENNLTRILARILKDNYYFADMFFRLINKKLIKNGYSTIYDDLNEQNISVDIQRTIGDLKAHLDTESNSPETNKEFIIGIGLTAENIDFNNEKSETATDKQRPDINIDFNNYHFIVEAKKTKEDCGRQLKGYLDSLGAVKMVSISWEDVIKLLEITNENGFGDIITTEYLQYIKNHFPKLFDYRSLKYSCTETGIIKYHDMVTHRMELVLINMASIDNNNEFEAVENLQIYLKKRDFQQRINLWVDKGNNRLYLQTWLNSTKGQMWNFFEYFEHRKFKLINEKQTIYPYIKFSNQGKGHYHLNLNSQWCENIDLYEQLYNLLGRAYGEKLKNNTNKILELTDTNDKLEVHPEIIDYISRNVEKDLSIEFAIEDYIDLSDLVKLDDNNNTFNKNMDAAEDKVANYIYDYIVKNMVYYK